MKFEFDKFVKDLEKRQLTEKERSAIANHVIDEDIRRRRRAELYHERWQNQVKWER